MSEKNHFRFWVPLTEITKGKDKDGNDIMKLGGIASTRSRDTDGEILDPNGFDLSYFKQRGHVNWNHSKEPSDIVGEVAKAEVRKDGLWVESTLFPTSKRAKQVYELAQTLKKDSSKLKLGYSIEGKVIERDPTDQSRVTSAFISAVALTPSPKNPDSIVDIIKGNFHGWGDDDPTPPLDPIDFDEANGGDQHIIDITRPDGKRVTVDKNYNIKIHKAATVADTNIPVGESEEEVEEEEEAGKNKKKALTTTSGAAVIPEHVDGETKPMLNGGPQPTSKNSMTKSEDDDTNDDIHYLTEEEALCRIMKSNSVITFHQAEQLLQTLNTLTMAKNGNATTISEDLLEKSLKQLGFTKTADINKGGKKRVGGEEEEEIDEEEEDEDEGGKEPAGKNKKPGLKVKTPLKKSNAIKKKYDDEDELDDEEDPEEEDRDEEGDEDEEVDEPQRKKKGMKKANRSNIRKSITAQALNEVPEAIEELTENVGELKDMVKSLAVIAKHSFDLVKAQQDELGELREQIEAFGAAPAGQRKSIVRKAVDRNFEKGMNGDDTIEKGEDGAVVVDVVANRNQVLNMLDHLAFTKGQTYNPIYGDALKLFETSGTMQPNIQKGVENEFKVKLVRR